MSGEVSTIDPNAVRRYGRWTRPSSTGLLGMSWGVTIMSAIAFVLVMAVVLLTQNYIAAAVLLLLEIIIILPFALHRGGITVFEWLVRRMLFSFSLFRGENDFNGGVFGKVPGIARMPGIAGNSHLYEYELSTGERFGMIHWRGKDHYSIVFAVSPRGQERIDQWQINEWITGVSDLLAHQGAETGASAVVITADSIPDHGERLRAEVVRIHDPQAPEFVLEAQAAEVYERGSATVRTEVRLALTYTRQRGVKEPLDQAKAIGNLVSTLKDDLRRAGVSASILSAGEIATIPMRAYNPELTGDLEAISQSGGQDVVRWDAAGPMSATNKFDRYLHNGHVSVSWVMAEPPSITVPATNLTPLLTPRTSLVRKRVSIVYRIHRSKESVAMVDADFREAVAAEQSKSGPASAAATIRVQNAQAVREEQGYGAGLTRFGMYITLTAERGDDLPGRTAELEGLAMQSRLLLRRCWADQDAAFLASLGLGVIMPEYAVGRLRFLE